jgi:catechol 2,3-dioxygenase-like lactoylglutathione lyase family enzyme
MSKVSTIRPRCVREVIGLLSASTSGREGASLAGIRSFDHVGITVADLDTVTAFFVTLGFEVEGRAFVEGDFIDTVIGIPNSRSEIVMLRPPGGGTGLEVARFVRPSHEQGPREAASTELGLRNVGFEVDDLDAILERLAADGYGLVGGVGAYEGAWRMAHVRGPEGIIVALAQRTD